MHSCEYLFGRVIYTYSCCGVMYQLDQFSRNQHNIVDKKQLYLCVGIHKLFTVLCKMVVADSVDKDMLTECR